MASGDQVVLFVKSVFDKGGITAALKSMDEVEAKARKAGAAASKGAQDYYKSGTIFGKEYELLAGKGGIMASIGGHEFLATAGQIATAAAGVAAAVGIATVAVKEYYEISREGAENRQLEESYDRFIRNVGASSNTLDQMIEATNMTMSRMSAMEGMLTLVAGTTGQTGKAFADAAPELAEIAKAANKLNPTLGDTNFMFNSLARGIKRSEVRLIDNLGLNVKVERANRDYAAAIGKTVEQLSSEDKQLALLNETLRVGRLLIDQVGGSTEAQTDKYIALSAAAKDLRAEMSMTFGAKEFPGIGSLSQLMQDMTAELRAQRTAEMGIQAGVITHQEASLMLYNKQYDKLKEIVEARQRMIEQYGIAGEKKAIQDAIELGNTLVDGWDKATQAKRAYYDPFFKYRGDYTDTSDLGLVYDVADAQEELAKVSGKHVAEAMSEAEKATADYNEGLRDLKKTVEEHNLEALAERQQIYAERVKETGDILRSVSGDESLYTTTIDNIGTAWVKSGGYTEDQKELLEDLGKAQERALKNVRDYSLGIKGWGQEQDKINEKIAEYQQQADHLGLKIQEVKGSEEEWHEVHRGAEWDQKKLNNALLEATAAAGKGAIEYADLKVAVGDWDETQRDAAIRAASMQDQIRIIGESSGTAAEKIEAMDEAARRLSEIDLSNLFKIEDMTGGELIEDQFGELGDRMAQKAIAGGTPGDIVFADLEEKARVKAGAAKQSLIDILFIGAGKRPENTATIYVENDIDSLTRAQYQVNELIKEETKIINIRVVGEGPPQQPTWTPLPSSDTGGEVFAGMPYIVGGQGPELFVPGAYGSIIPNNKLLGGAGNVTIINNNYTAEAAAVAAATAEWAAR